MKKLFATIVFAISTFQIPANASVVVTSVGKTPQAAVAGSSYITFEDVAVGTIGAFSSGGYGFTGTGAVVTGTNDTPFVHLAPKFDDTRYLAINSSTSSPLTATLTLGTDYTKFGVLLGLDRWK